MKTVLLVAPGEIFGGVERFLVVLCSKLCSMGVNPVIVLFSDGEAAACIRETGTPVFVLQDRGALSYRYVTDLRRIADEVRADVVHVHGYKANVYASIAFGKSLPIVKTEHGRVETGDSSLLDRLKMHAYAALDQLATNVLRPKLCAVTGEIARDVRSRYNREDVCVIYNGYQLDEKPGPVNRTSSPPYCVVAAGRLVEVKGFEYLIAAARILPETLDISIHIFGEGPLRGSLEEQIRHLEVEDKVKLDGFTPKILNQIMAADLVVVPSLHEGLPYILLEAFALGKPVVASRVGGLDEVLVDEESALLVPPADPAVLAAAVERVLLDKNLRDKLQQSGRELIRSQFNADVMAGSYRQTYESVLH